MASAGELAGQLGLNQLALLAEFDGDPEAVDAENGAEQRIAEQFGGPG